MKKILASLFIATLFATPVLAKGKKHPKRKLNWYVQKASELTGKHYLTTSELKGNAHFSKKLKLTKENADLLLSYILNENGYTRIPVKGTETYRIINSRDVRYNSVPQYHADKTTYPNIPETADYIMFTYSFKHKDHGITTEVTRSFRPFMSRYGRIIDLPKQGKIVVQDTAINIKRLYSLIKDVDVEPSSEQLEKWEENRKHRRKVALLKAENCQQNVIPAPNQK